MITQQSLKTQIKRAAKITYIMAHNPAYMVEKKHNSNKKKKKTTEYTTSNNITTANKKKYKNNKDTRYDNKPVNGKSNSCRRCCVTAQRSKFGKPIHNILPYAIHGVTRDG